MKNYYLGIGCRRGTDFNDINNAVTAVLAKNNMSFEDIKKVVSVDLKSDEIGLLEFIKKYNYPSSFFSSKQLNEIEVPNPSNMVKSKIGINSVSEASAILASINKKLVVEKQKLGNLTIAIAT